MSKPRLLDLFCGIGGASCGYQLAGFHVTGVDINPQPHYIGDAFIQADAMTFDLSGYDVIRASPPCQAYSITNAALKRKHTLDLLPVVRKRLIEAHVPWIIENVPGAPMLKILRLCGQMFGLRLYRHRFFESNMLLFEPFHPRHVVPASTANRKACWDAGGNLCVVGKKSTSLAIMREAMGIDWGDPYGITQAVPPAYTEWIGRQLHQP